MEPTKTPAKVTPLAFKVLSQVEAKPIHWLWEPYIPRKAVTLIMGDGGYGKSWMTCAIAADLSAGRPLPGQAALPPQRILMISAEDEVSQIIKPKMVTLNANMENIAVYDDGFVLNPHKVNQIVAAMKDFDATVVFLDPLVVYMGGQIDINRANETRSVMAQLTEAAKRLDVAVVVVHHIRKQQGGAAQHKVMGSADLVNSVRSVMLADVSKGGQRYMAHVKHNWSAPGATLAYAFDGKSFVWTGEYTGEVKSDHEISLTRRGEAKAFLVNALKDGPLSSLELIKRAEADGLSERTISRAKRGVARSIKKKDGWFVELEPAAIAEVAREQQELYLAPVPSEPSEDDPEAVLRRMGGLNGPDNKVNEPVARYLADIKARIAAKAAQNG